MKEKYQIPYTLDAHLSDTKTQLKLDNGAGFDKEFTVRGILTFILSATAWGWLVFQSPLKGILSFTSGSPIGLAIFSLGYAGVCYFGLREISVPGLHGYNVFFPLMRYLKRRKQPKIRTESFEPYSNGMQMTGMGEPDEKGLLRFKDGSYGIVYKIIGAASNNAFSVDRRNSIDSFQNFLRTLPKSTTYAFITNTGGQNVERQLRHLFELYDNEKDISIMTYIAEEIRELGDYVQKNFVALHQFLIIRGDDEAVLLNSKKQIEMFVEQNGNVINFLARPKPSEEKKMFRSIYCGLETHINKRLEEFSKNDGQKSEVSSIGKNRINQPHQKRAIKTHKPTGKRIKLKRKK